MRTAIVWHFAGARSARAPTSWPLPNALPNLREGRAPARPPPVRHLAAPLSGLFVASASGSVGVLEGGEELAAKNEEERKEHENP